MQKSRANDADELYTKTVQLSLAAAMNLKLHQTSYENGAYLCWQVPRLTLTINSATAAHVITMYNRRRLMLQPEFCKCGTMIGYAAMAGVMLQPESTFSRCATCAYEEIERQCCVVGKPGLEPGRLIGTRS